MEKSEFQNQFGGLNRVKILLIEDDEGDAFLVRELLMEAEQFNFDLIHVERLSHGLDVLASERCDVILLDLSLPDGYGPEIIYPVQEAANGIPIIILTGLDSEGVGIQLVKEGVQDYLVKDSFDSQNLIRAIRYAIERQRMLFQLEKARELEQYLAYHDALTSLPNRKLFYDRLAHTISRARRNDKMVGVMFLDLDGFKRINDTLGHGAGDELLKITAERLKHVIRESDTVARLGGDEFTVIIDHISQEQDVISVCDKILRTLEKPYKIDSNEFFITSSIGVSLYPFDGENIEELIKNADVAMYRAKGAGKNNYQFYNISMDAQAMEHLEMERSLRRALENNELYLHYQPLFNMQQKTITSLEALVRWQHPELGNIPPSKFIPIAEETGLINPLGEWIINTACIQNKTLQAEGYQPVRVAINLSTHQFRDKNLFETVTNALDKSRLNPQFMSLEITESSVMRDVEYAIDTLQAFKDLGIQVAVDDFGTGYSSLSYLKQLPADTLKIDRSFIDGIPTDRNDASITSAIIGLAHNLELGVVAEGVETSEQLSYLQQLKCDEMQGYHLSKPLPFDTLKTVMS